MIELFGIMWDKMNLVNFDQLCGFGLVQILINRCAMLCMEYIFVFDECASHNLNMKLSFKIV